MSDVTLSDGREITFDLNKITYREYRKIFDEKENEKESDEKIARVCGLSYEDYDSLPLLDHRRVFLAFFKKAAEPMSDPNSPSAPS